MKKKQKNGESEFYRLLRKGLLIMKCFLLLMFISVLSSTASVYSQNKRFTLKENSITVKDVFKKIEEQSKFRFFYEEGKLNVLEKKNVNFQNSTIDEVLNHLFNKSEVDYRILENDFIVLKVKPEVQDVYRQAQQSKKVSGKVTDPGGQPLPGVTVVVKGTTQGTVTNSEGDYSLSNISEGATLVFSFLGMKAQEVAVAGQSRIDVSMEEETIGLEEVVAVGYGTVKKIDLTGSVGSISSETIAQKGSVNAMEAIQGRVAGVDIGASSGRAGTEFSINIRGVNSLEGGSPIYVVDGIVTGDINYLNPQDIERIDILKDASSSAVYGSRGSNGVVIITTKQGASIKKSGTTISYDGYYGVRSVARMPDFMGGLEWWKYRQNAYISNAILKNTDYDETVGGWIYSPFLRQRVTDEEFTDWADVVTQTGNQQNHWLSIAGKSENGISYVIATGYQNEKGNIINESLDKYNLKANIYHKISEKWETGMNLNLAVSEQELGSSNSYVNAFRLPPIASPYDSLGNLLYQPAQYDGFRTTGTVNPLLDMENSKDNTRRFVGLGNVFLQYSPVKGLALKSTFAPRIDHRRRGRYYGSLTEERKKEDPAAEINHDQSFSFIWDNQVTYTKEIDEHKLDLLGLYSVDYFREEASYIRAENLPYNSLFHNVGTAKSYQQISSAFLKSTLLSFVGRVNYSFSDKYLVTVSNRWDGSSKLAEGYKWASFPSAAIAWRVSGESFLEDNNVISNLKTRISYGYTGNNNIDPYTTQLLSSTQTFYDFGGEIAKGYAPNGIVNKSLTWERTREWNFGVDIGLFQGRISGAVDLYDRLSNELLMTRKLPVETGWGSLIDNVGSVSNKGIELLLRTINIETRDLTWETTFTFTRNKNEIVELYGGTEDDIGNSWFIGEPVSVNYTYVFDGIWQEDERAEALKYGQLPGQAKVKDLDDNDAINSDDKRIIGSRYPDWYGSFNTTLRYKGFDASASLLTRQGVHVYSSFHRNFTDFTDRGRNKISMSYYIPENTVYPANYSNEYPMVRNAGPYWKSVGYYKDASFVKMKNITLGYTIPQRLLSKYDLKYARLYVNVLNPFVWTEYDGYDPEWASASFGRGGNSFVTYQFGVNLKF
ncbi:SusC/RagA family TonB-linked outer membrane protein [Mariniphaga sediminis]|uniref:SusC/RagA family TonB-linked outer membrane protein n=2 Tax=Mariniphaga sediminis TaxID=1628158 RepID=A0A399D3Y0_9BACT|nr:SusC/RagA family TonB-linked outer membrane protein [Mariniphaga sediminis]